MNALSYSDINTYQRCPKKAYYRTVLGIQPKRRNPDLMRGISAHEILKVFFLGLQGGLSTQEAWEEAKLHSLNLIDEAKDYMFTDELFDMKQEVEHLVKILDRYIDRYRDQWEILHVEETFYVTLDTGLIISFTPDLIVRDKRSKSVWIIDHKTTSAVPDSGLPFGDTQALLYYTGIKSLYPELAGFIFSRIRKKLPMEPRLTKTGDKRVADLQRIDTTYEVLRDFLTAEAPDLLSDPMHQRRMAELRDGNDRFLWTETIYVNETTAETILNDVEYVAQQIEQSAESGVWPRSLREDRGYTSCSRCPYANLCHAEMVGWDVSGLEDDFEPADPKNPYEGELNG